MLQLPVCLAKESSVPRQKSCLPSGSETRRTEENFLGLDPGALKRLRRGWQWGRAGEDHRPAPSTKRVLSVSVDLEAIERIGRSERSRPPTPGMRKVQVSRRGVSPAKPAPTAEILDPPLAANLKQECRARSTQNCAATYRLAKPYHKAANRPPQGPLSVAAPREFLFR